MAWVAVPFESADLPTIGQFFKKQYTGPGTYGTMDLFQWKIIDNYIQPGFINLVKDNGRIVCTMSVTPKRLFFKGHENIVAEIGDIYTVFKYRRYGLFALLANQSTKETIEKGINFVYGLPNSQAKPGWEKRANYKTISGVNIKSLVLPINIKPFIQRKSHWLVGVYANLMYSTIFYGYLLAKGFLSRSMSATIEEPEIIPDNWDKFWEMARQPYDFIFARDREALTWRFIRNPDKYRFYILRDSYEILGYIVYRIIYDAEIATLHIADFLSLPGREKDIEILLFRVLRDAFNGNVTKVNVWCTKGSPYFDIFKRFGFLERNNIPLISFQNDFSSNIQESCRNWHFTISDSDNI